MSISEKYYLWFKCFNAHDRVRLWNRLVLAREWFKMMILFSKLQVRVKNKLNKSSTLTARFSKQNLQDIDDEDNYTLVRHDLQMLLKDLARRMFEKGVSSEEILLQKYVNV